MKDVPKIVQSYCLRGVLDKIYTCLVAYQKFIEHEEQQRYRLAEPLSSARTRHSSQVYALNN